MKIVVWGKHYPPAFGGIEAITRSLARGFAAKGHEIQVVAFGGERAQTVLDGDVIVHNTRTIARLSSQPVSLDYVRTALRAARDADLIHVHLPNMLTALAMLRLPRGQKVLLHWHSDYVGGGVLGRIARAIELYLARRAHRIIATSRVYAEASPALRRHRGKLIIAPLGVADFAHAPGSRDLPPEVASFLAGRPFVLSVGRLVPYKGFEVLVDAAGALRTSTAVVIAGSGPSKSALLERIDRQRLGDRILLHGSVSDETRDALYRHACAYVSASVNRAEAFGLSIIEAMSHGLPIIASRIEGSGVPWVAGEGAAGPLVEPGDAAALAAAIDRVASCGEEASAWSRIARERYEALFLERKMWVNVIDAVEQLVGQQTTTGP